MRSTVEFPFSDDEALPTIPVILSYADSSVSANALLDTGSTVNLLPYDIGLQLGAIWDNQTVRLPLAGNLAKVEASHVPLILGQTNFFREFDVCFERSQCTIKIIRRDQRSH
jgi:hypothetical protein